MRTLPKKSRNYGFGLIEVLITLLVFSVGVLAVAGLQAISKKNNFDALQRTTAANLAESIIASIRANPDPDARLLYLVPTSDPRGSRANISVPTNCYTNPCTPTELALFDLYQWELALDGAGEVLVQERPGFAATAIQTGGLAAPSACISRNGSFYQVVIAWRGVTQLDATLSNPCGAGRSLYGTAENANDTSYQRFFVLNTYINP